MISVTYFTTSARPGFKLVHFETTFLKENPQILIVYRAHSTHQREHWYTKFVSYTYYVIILVS